MATGQEVGIEDGCETSDSLLLPPRQFNLAQRVVTVVGIGLALCLVGDGVTSWGSHSFPGWVSYAPFANQLFSPVAKGFQPWFRPLIWMFFVAMWSGIGLFLFRKPNHAPAIGKVGMRCRTVERGHGCAWRLLPVGREQLAS